MYGQYGETIMTILKRRLLPQKMSNEQMFTFHISVSTGPLGYIHAASLTYTLGKLPDIYAECMALTFAS